MRRSFLLFASAAVALSGCAAVPNLGPKPQPKAAVSYAASESFQAPAVGWPADRWWTTYGDPQLNALVDEALAGSPSIAQAQARVRRAAASEEQARGETLPYITANGKAAVEKQSYNNGIPALFVPRGYNDTGRATLDLSWDLDVFGKNRAALAAASSEAEATRLDAAQAALVLAATVVDAYSDLGRLFAERAATERAVENRGTTAKLVSQRVEQGSANAGEGHQAEASQAMALQDLAALDEQIALTRNRLAALLGAGPDRGLSISAPPKVADRSFGLPPNLAVDLLGRRPDVQAARLRVEAAAKRVKVVKAGFYPDISLNAFFGVQSLGLNNLTRTGSDIGSGALAFRLPIFSAGIVQGAYRGARADYDLAVAQYDQTLVQALQQVADVAASQRALGIRLSQARKGLAASEEAYRIAGLRYQGGLSNYITALTAEDAVIAQRRTVADLEARSLSLDAALARALGGGFRAS